MDLFRKRPKASPAALNDEEHFPQSNDAGNSSGEKGGRQHRVNHNGHKVTPGIHPDGESGRKGIHPIRFVKILFRSSSKVSQAVNVLWPFVPAAIALHFARKDQHDWIFALNYLAIIPTANLIGFAGQELARKLPKVPGIIFETFLGSIVEIVLFMVLIRKHDPPTRDLVPVIQAAIIGSILANLLFCLGFCFFFGGIRGSRSHQTFNAHISEVGNGLLLTAGFGLSIPAAFSVAINSSDDLTLQPGDSASLILKISRATAVILLFAFLLYVFFQLRTHDGYLEKILEEDEEKDADRQRDLKKNKLTLTECIVALVIALTFVSLHAIFLVEEIESIVTTDGVSDLFLGLILVPFVEKLAEHLTAIDEAWDNQMNFALAHVLGATIQTALLNSSLVVIVGWGLGKDMNLNFEIFLVILLILAILVVGNFLRDGESNYLEGALCVLIYLIIAVTTFYYPNVTEAEEEGGEAPTGEGTSGEAKRMLLRRALAQAGMGDYI